PGAGARRAAAGAAQAPGRDPLPDARAGHRRGPGRRARDGGDHSMKYGELKDLNSEQLAAQLQELRAEHFNLRFQLATRQLTNTARIRQVKRDIARVMTRQRELELQAMEA